MSAIPLIGVIAAAAFLAVWVLPPERYRRFAAGLVPAAVGAGSLRAGLGTDRLDLLLGRAGPVAAGDRWFLVAGAGLVVAGGLAALVLALLPARSSPGSPRAAPVRQGSRDLVVLVLGLIALVVPWVPATLGFAFLAGALAAILPGRPVAVRLPVAAGAVLLAVSGSLLATIIGPVPSTYHALQNGPVGDPAARLLVLLLGGTVMLWLASPALLPAGAALLGRLAGSLMPVGIVTWQALGMPLALLLAGVSLARRRPGFIAAALGSYGLWCGARIGWIGAGLLYAAALPTGLFFPAPVLAHRGAAGLAGAGLMLIIAGGLSAEVGYTILLAAGAFVVLLRRWDGSREVASP